MFDWPMVKRFLILPLNYIDGTKNDKCSLYTSFVAMSEMVFSIPIWKHCKTKDVKMLFEAQDFFTE